MCKGQMRGMVTFFQPMIPIDASVMRVREAV